MEERILQVACILNLHEKFMKCKIEVFSGGIK
jgi:hypothetical protein